MVFYLATFSNKGIFNKDVVFKVIAFFNNKIVATNVVGNQCLSFFIRANVAIDKFVNKTNFSVTFNTNIDQVSTISYDSIMTNKPIFRGFDFFLKKVFLIFEVKSSSPFEKASK